MCPLDNLFMFKLCMYIQRLLFPTNACNDHQGINDAAYDVGICITTIEQLTKTGSMIGNGSNFFPLFYATLSPGLLFIQLFFLKIIEVYCDEFVLILLKVKIGPENQWYQ
ncbi:hypothetical protein HS088_TW09G00841 [Tripterygium wilfordii]|uniref:Uncharacterized protein n=1 Tax=Tripterygium wilfordii TaxID=458696 RepID=A0A7J7D8Z2_TRIWF|nr:hypothetical protein HS088_TW09G00841 [Tripterygium wilfordii]